MKFNSLVYKRWLNVLCILQLLRYGRCGHSNPGYKTFILLVFAAGQPNTIELIIYRYIFFGFSIPLMCGKFLSIFPTHIFHLMIY